MKLKWPKRDRRLIDDLFPSLPHDFEEGEPKAVIEELTRLKQVEVNAFDRAYEMAGRVDRIQEWLCWHRLWARQTTIKHPDGKEDVLDNALPAGQRPTFATPWTDHVNADGVADIRSIEHFFWDRGVKLPIKIIANSVTLSQLLKHAVLRYYFNVPKHWAFEPTLDQVAQLLAVATEFVVYDGGFRDAFTDEHTKHLPDGTVVFAAQHDWLVPVSDEDSEHIGQLLDQGEFLGEVEVDGERMMKASRIVVPEVVHPECLVVAQAMA